MQHVAVSGPVGDSVPTPTPTSTPTLEPTPESGPDASVIAPAVVIPVIGSAAIAVLVVLLIKRKKNAKKRVESHNEPGTFGLNRCKVRVVNPSLDTNYSPIGIIGQREMTVKNPINTSSKGDRMNISRDNLVIGKEIGKGSYGRVHLGVSFDDTF